MNLDKHTNNDKTTGVHLRSFVANNSKSRPIFLFLLPAFFFLHGLKENLAPGLSMVVITQTIIYSLAGVLLALVFFPFFRNWRKAALYSLILLAFNFFFGAIQDALRSLMPGSFFTRYSFIIPFLAFILAILFIYIKRAKHEFSKTFLFLNFLFIILILIETAGIIAMRKSNYSSIYPTQITKPETRNPSPDIYFIITDEYAGKQELKDIFSFDNSAFEDQLRSRGFHVEQNTNANYNATVYSLASMLAMDTIAFSGNGTVTQRDMLLGRHIIEKNPVSDFFRNKGYTFHNLSFFDFAGKKKTIKNPYFPPKARIFTAQTFIQRIKKELGFRFFTVKKVLEIQYHDLVNDQKVERYLEEIISIRETKPKFVYAHFNMPHHPYYFGRNGQPLPKDSLQGFERTKKEYTEYLQYTNQSLLETIDHIQKASAKPPVIILASDHGFRQFPSQADKKYYFMNLCAVNLPNRNYTGFYDDMSMVNLFRVILNAQFGQNLPMKPDSRIFLTEPQMGF